MNFICIAPYTNGCALKKWLIKTGRSITGIKFVGDYTRPKLNKATERTVRRYCPNVTSVFCSNQFDTDLYGKVACTWPKLKEFRPHYRFNGDCVASCIENYTALTSLDVSQIQYDSAEAAIALIKHCGPTLHSFRGGIAFHDSEDSIPLAVAKYCPNLRAFICSAKLKRAATTLTALLEGCPGLQELHLRDSLVQASSYEALASALGAQLISFHNMGIFCGGPYAIESFVRNCPNLRSLWISNREELSDTTAALVAQNCPGIEELKLDSNCQASAHAILTIAAGCSRLRDFNLDYSALQPSEFIEMMTLCPHLTQLRLTHCDCVTDISLLVLPDLCPHITHLCLGGSSLGDIGLRAVVLGCRKLQYLQVPAEWSRYAAYLIRTSELFRPKLVVEAEAERTFCVVM
jgi:hypothetical protein